LNIEILGVNEFDQAASNSAMTAGRTLPWLQDTAQAAVWTNWNVLYRDFRILDSQNRLYAIYNLTQHDLAVAANRDTLKQLLLQAAQTVDSNRDGLPDDWQLQYFGSLSSGPQADPDGDGLDNFAEYAFGTNPADPRSLPTIRARLSGTGPQRSFTFTFRRRAGSALDYVIETSPDLKQWSTNDITLRLLQGPRNLFDGTGTSEVTYSLSSPSPTSLSGFLKVRASSPVRE
jgi:hypothetical protein